MRAMTLRSEKPWRPLTRGLRSARNLGQLPVHIYGFLFIWSGAVVVGLAPAEELGSAMVRVQAIVERISPMVVRRSVMFAHIPEEVVKVRVYAASGEEHTLADLSETRSIGYQAARAYMNFMAAPGWLRHLCGSRADLEGATIALDLYSVRWRDPYVRQTRLTCAAGRLSGGDSDALRP